METNASKYDAMWRDLGLNLEAHAKLLEVLGSMYGSIFLTQPNRPKGTGYLDFVLSEIHGLRIEELRAAQREGRKVIGSFCLYVPEEILLAADAVSVGLCAGADVGSQVAEAILPRNSCALIKSFLGFKLERICPYVEASDLVIGETTCDGKTKAYEIFAQHKNTFVLQIPRMKSPAGRALWRAEVGRLVARVEEATGRAISVEKLTAAIRVVNAKRRALQRLSALRAARPSPISGLDALLVNQVQFYDDPVRFTAQLDALCDEVTARIEHKQGVAPADAPRVLISGCPMAAPNWKVPHVVETSGAVIVGEESCVGERATRNLVDDGAATRDVLLDRIADRYLKIDCAVFTPNPGRVEHVLEMARAYHADGVIHYVLQFCTPYAAEAYGVGRALERAGIPMLQLETDYGMGDVPQLQTRVQAFLEVLRQ